MKSVQQFISNNFLPFLVVAFAAGILTGSLADLPLNVTFAFAILTGLVLPICYLKAADLSGYLTTILLFFIAGITAGTISSQEPNEPHHIYNLIDQQRDIVAVGRLLTMPSFDGTTSQAKINLQSIRIGTDLPHQPAIGTILLRIPAPWPQEYRPGTLLAIRAIMQRPAAYGVPGVFDYPAELARQNIWVTAFSRSTAQLHAIADTTTLLQNIRYIPEIMRNSVGEFLDDHTDHEIAGLYRAILLGDRSRLPDTTLEYFKASGTMHILAISGIHLTIIGALLFSLLYWLLRRSEWLLLHTNVKKVTGLICLPLLLGYTLLAGSNTPVIRACIMSMVFIFAFCNDRTRTLSSLIAFGALLILASSPQTLFTVSFQLSFAAFISIALIMPVIQPLIHNQLDKGPMTFRQVAASLRNWALSALFASTAAVLGTAPIVIYHFHRLPLAGPIANLVMEPLICLWALPFGFLALPFIGFVPTIATALLTIGSGGLHLAVSFAELIQMVPKTSLWLPRPAVFLVILYYCALSLMLLSQGLNIKLFRRHLSACLYILLLALLIFPVSPHLISNSKTAAVNFLDVGQGSATLIRFPDNTHMLIDGGGSAFSRETVGQRIIAPFLWDSGITKLETIVLTHPDGDHTNGVPFLLEHFSVQQLFISNYSSGNKQYEELIKMARRQGVKVNQAYSGDILQAGETSVICLANTGLEYGGGNNEGLVISLQRGNTRLLFPGDIDSNTEKGLIAMGKTLSSDILLAAHHGSSSSNSPEFLEQVAPQTIIVSAGRSRKTLFPSEQLREYCTIRQIPLLETSEKGSIRLELKEQTTEIAMLKDLQKNPLRRRHDTWQTTERITVRKE
ncbi:DNA internalization-related competence protein ComEC/Rec2 [Desulfopila aestuarii]|uniref:Competence protein ComEC n=1 Tax=Desulfopila aestuarii DSM 18488 TaxID=1121416 RepID=A0A1M7YGE9_9BACT|nr:DNA internalization-related competence protein ComEC/Rec2 [Desulfopila aestuarii]SHO51683.1 competence protein ComEC [Desulfopila aestuarii DSM 18488]